MELFVTVNITAKYLLSSYIATFIYFKSCLVHAEEVQLSGRYRVLSNCQFL
jgi:hypothetical protein